MSKFDPTKPFGQVFGSAAGVRFEQGGRFYNAQKRLIDADGKLLPEDEGEAESPEAPKQEAPKPAAKPSAKKPAAKKSEPEGVKPLREQAKEEAQ
jgi:hypothetical protein